MLLGLTLFGACSGPHSESAEEESETRLYHVQLQLTEDKDRAVEILSHAQQWWTEQPSSERPPLATTPPSSKKPITIKWRAPFYRVRLGPFATKQEAETVLEAAKTSFPDAFVSPERVDKDE